MGSPPSEIQSAAGSGLSRYSCATPTDNILSATLRCTSPYGETIGGAKDAYVVLTFGEYGLGLVVALFKSSEFYRVVGSMREKLSAPGVCTPRSMQTRGGMTISSEVCRWAIGPDTVTVEQHSGKIDTAVLMIESQEFVSAQEKYQKERRKMDAKDL